MTGGKALAMEAVLTVGLVGSIATEGSSVSTNRPS